MLYNVALLYIRIVQKSRSLDRKRRNSNIKLIEIKREADYATKQSGTVLKLIID